jgi:hypothetical protein
LATDPASYFANAASFAQALEAASKSAMQNRVGAAGPVANQRLARPMVEHY